MRYLTLIFCLLCMIIQPADAQNSDKLAGNWKGSIEANMELLIKTHFQKRENDFKGTIDIQSVNLPLQNIRTPKNDSVHFEFQSGNGLAAFEGSFQNDSTITGIFKQKGFTFPFKLHRFEPDTVTAQQAKKSPPAYNHKDLIIKNDSVKIGGTLTWPKGKESNQLVVMISGSGSQDRNEATSVTDFKPFAELADSLTNSGIATFRYDDRGIGKSTGHFSDATLSMLASDVETIIDHFSDDPNHDFQTIVLLGHSQGGVVGGKIAREDNRVGKLILMASPGVTLKRVLRAQVMNPLKKVPIDKKLEIQEVNAREDLMRAIKNKHDVKQAKENYQQKFKIMQIAAGADSSDAEQMAKGQTKTLVKVYGTPQMQSLLFYNPTDDLKNLDIPVLALFGGKDTQVSVQLNKNPTAKALDKANVAHKIKTFKNANHLYQKAKTGKVQEYSTLKSQFVDDFLPTIEHWLKETSKN